ncbi:MAG: hypothetical protein ABSC95_06665 [Acetobacteraceae bacterium]
MRDTLTSPAQAYAPDADRAGPEGTAHLPEWLVHCLARLILFLLEHWLADRRGRSPRLPAWWHDRPDLPLASAQAEAASVRGSFGRSIAWMCRRRGIGPGHPEWPELSRAIVAFGGSLKGFRAGAPPRGLYWWENPDLVPGMIGATAAAPTEATTALRLARGAVADTLAPVLNAVAAEAGHVLVAAAWVAASWRAFVRPGTGPPTGPPAAWASCLELPTLSYLTHGAGTRLAPLY